MNNSFRGFTLMELMISVAILGVIMAAAAPPFLRYLQERNLDEQAGALTQAFSTARSLAISKAISTQVCWNSEGAAVDLPAPDDSIEIASGEIAVIDPSETTSDERLTERKRFLNAGFQSINNFASAPSGEAQCVSFGPQGRAQNTGSLVLCQASGEEVDSVSVVINVNGRAVQVDGNQIPNQDCV